MAGLDDPGLYSIAQMRAADAGAIEHGVPGIDLMERAGAAVAAAIREHYAQARILVLCGPGNNGGDGFVLARCLREAGWPVVIATLDDPAMLKDDAAIARDRWAGATHRLDSALLTGGELVVDALFGAGLARPIEGRLGAFIERLNQLESPIIAVDMPSGIDGDTGEARGVAVMAALTVTFHRGKPGHYLLPGREHAGRLQIVDIGIPASVDRALGIDIFANIPALWRSCFPSRAAASHKYSHGHALVLGGPMRSSGAARLAARAALRAGAGLVTVLCPAAALPVYAASLTTIMIDPFKDQAEFAAALSDPRRNVILLGPGAGIGEPLRERVLASLAANKATVLDADALTSFTDMREDLFQAIRRNVACLLTPHEGEFERLFGLKGDKLKRARTAADRSGAVVLLKGADTVVASPDGRASILTEAPASLATAGSGDVLAGIALGLMAQGMPVFEAACAAAWLHAEAARQFGPGLIAEDLPERLPKALGTLAERGETISLDSHLHGQD